jgi:hypothetical protein
VQDATGMATEAHRTCLKVNASILKGGDGCYLTPSVSGMPPYEVATVCHFSTTLATALIWLDHASSITLTGVDAAAEFLLFDMAPLPPAATKEAVPSMF